MQFIDLAFQQKQLKSSIEKNIAQVLNHGAYIMGPEISDLEKRLSNYVGVEHGISCSSGTDALLLALMAYGVGPGDAIFVPSFTFIATAEVISILGATPVFVDIDPETFNIDPGKLEQAIEAALSNDASLHPLPRQKTQSAGLNPRGIIAVDLFGLTADYDKISTIAQKSSLFVIEDAAQSFGAENQSKKSCALADIACTSFFPAKPLGCYGDGGMCFTDNSELAVIMQSLRVHGKGSHKYDNERIGINGRLDTLQAAILLAKFDIFPEEVAARQQVAERYKILFSKSTDICPPKTPAGLKSVWAQYSLLAKDQSHRRSIQQNLKEYNIPSAVYYPNPLHFQTAFSPLEYQIGDLPISEDYSQRIFSIPMHPYLTLDDQNRVAEAILNCR